RDGRAGRAGATEAGGAGGGGPAPAAAGTRPLLELRRPLDLPLPHPSLHAVWLWRGEGGVLDAKSASRRGNLGTAGRPVRLLRAAVRRAGGSLPRAIRSPVLALARLGHAAPAALLHCDQRGGFRHGGNAAQRADSNAADR